MEIYKINVVHFSIIPKQVCFVWYSYLIVYLMKAPFEQGCTFVSWARQAMLATACCLILHEPCRRETVWQFDCLSWRGSILSGSPLVAICWWRQDCTWVCWHAWVHRLTIDSTLLALKEEPTHPMHVLKGTKYSPTWIAANHRSHSDLKQTHVPFMHFTNKMHPLASISFDYHAKTSIRQEKKDSGDWDANDERALHSPEPCNLSKYLRQFLKVLECWGMSTHCSNAWRAESANK